MKKAKNGLSRSFPYAIRGKMVVFFCDFWTNFAKYVI